MFYQFIEVASCEISTTDAALGTGRHRRTCSYLPLQ